MFQEVFLNVLYDNNKKKQKPYSSLGMNTKSSSKKKSQTSEKSATLTCGSGKVKVVSQWIKHDRATFYREIMALQAMMVCRFLEANNNDLANKEKVLCSRGNNNTGGFHGSGVSSSCGRGCDE